MSATGVPARSASATENNWWRRSCQLKNDSVYFFDGIPVPHLAKEDAKTGDEYQDPAQAFIRSIHDDLANGYGFVPFIGAGFSVTAGIPMIRHLQQYLQRCICMALGIDVDADLQTLEKLQPSSTTSKRSKTNLPQGALYPRLVPRWNPRTDEWPPFIDRSRTPEDDRWERLLRLSLRDPERSKRAWLYRHALGAMQEWRTALEFLSHIEFFGDSRLALDSEDGPLRFCEPDRGIIDSCFREVMRDKRPSMNHRMLAALSAVLRIDLILTTNFDNLTEAAFDEYRNPLTAFDVHMGETLPDRATIGRARSIIKLHGSQRSLRADFSLEGLPNAEDRERFRDYLADRPIHHRTIKDPAEKDGDAQPNEKQASRHLLMLGVAAKEKRTVAFIRNALRFLPNLHVYWICYSEGEVKTVLQEFEDTTSKELHKSGDSMARVRVLRHTNAGLLFLQLYQSIRKSLPSHGAIFPSTSRLSFPPLPWQSSPFQSNAGYKDLVESLEQAIPEKKDNGTGYRLVVARSESGVFGVASAAGEIFRKRETTRNCLWLDLNDIHNADDLFEAFREAAFHYLNESDWSPLFQSSKNRSLAKGKSTSPMLAGEIVRIVNSSNQPWTLFLNARETPGANRASFDHPNGWMDDTRRTKRTAASAEDFIDMMKAFFKANETSQSNQIIVVVLCFSGKQRGSNLYGSHLLNRLAALQDENPSLVHFCDPLEANSNSIHSVAKVVQDVVEWTSDVSYEGTDEIRARRRFVQTLVSMQRPRHLSVAWARCVNSEWQLVSRAYDKDKLDWLEDLQHRHLIRLSHGGFIWFTAIYREALRALLALTPRQVAKGLDDPTVKSLFEKHKLNPAILRDLGANGWNATAHQADIHLSLSTWYRKVLDATGTAACVFEIVDHLCWAAADLLEYESVRFIEDEQHPLVEVPVDEDTRIFIATKHLKAARELLTEHLFLIQTQGYPGASLSRLKFLRNLWVGDKPKRRTYTVCDLIQRKLRLTHRRLERLKAGEPWDDRHPLNWKELARAIAKLQCTCDEVARAVYREVSEDRDAFRSHSHFGLRMVRDFPLSGGEVEAQLQTLTGKGQKLYMLIGDTFKRSDGQAAELSLMRNRKDEWIRWWKWCAMLGNDSRSFDAAERSSRRAIAASIRLPLQYPFDMEQVPDFTAGSDAESMKDLKNRVLWKFSLGDSGSLDAKGQLEALHSLEVAAFNLTLRANTLRRARTLGVQSAACDPTQERACDDDAFMYATKGLELVEGIQNTGTPRVDHDFELHWCKARLLMIAGISSLSKPKTDSRHAMTFLSDAAACLNSATPERSHSDLAIVELRCAEARLHEVSSEPFVEGSPAFDQWIYDFLAKPLEANEAVVRKTAESNQYELLRALRKVRSRTRDAVRFLDRAQRILRERRRNVFWTTWYFERRMRAIVATVGYGLRERNTRKLCFANSLPGA